MLRILSFSVVSALLASFALGEVDLKPRFYTVNLGGYTIRRPYFADGDKKFAVTIDSDTEVAEDNGGAVFRFKSIPQASVELRKSPVAAARGFGREILQDYNRLAQSMLGATASILLAS